jgi:SAM-dependent methyltransferase
VRPQTRTDAQGIDSVAAYYGAFPYPWRPAYFDAVDDPGFYSALIRQEAGRPGGSFERIWVAGCGTNQAVYTALRHPDATVVGTDVSAPSLALCEQTANQLGLKNLSLKQEEITHCDYTRQFDLIICTGVIHCNPEPARCLERLGSALRDDGVLELMVYNKFHRQETMAFQEAGRLLLPGAADQASRMRTARSLAQSVPAGSRLWEGLQETASDSDAAWGDSWAVPAETAYDLEALWSLAQDCGLIIEGPHHDAVNKSGDSFLWTVEIADPQLREAFHALDDRERWQVVNLLRFDNAPMLWFYLRPDRDGQHQRVSDAERNAIFLCSVPSRPTARRRRYLLDDEGTYQLRGEPTPVSSVRPRAEVRDVLALANGQRSGAEIFRLTGRESGFNSVYQARAVLTGPEFGHLVLRV